MGRGSEVLGYRRSPVDSARRAPRADVSFVAPDSSRGPEGPRKNPARVVAEIALKVLSDLGNELTHNSLPYIAAGAVAGGYSLVSNENIPASILGIGLGVVTAKLVEEWQKGPYHA